MNLNEDGIPRPMFTPTDREKAARELAAKKRRKEVKKKNKRSILRGKSK